MALSRNIVFNVFICVVFYAFTAAFSDAQTANKAGAVADAQGKTLASPVKTIPTAQSIARLIEEKGLVKSDSASDLAMPETVSEAISNIVNVLPLGDKELFDEALSNLRILAEEQQNPYDQGIVNLFTQYASLFDFNNVTENYQEITHFLQDVPRTEHWLVRFHAKRLLSVTHTHKRNNGLALQVAQEAMTLIPSEISEEATHTRISVTGLIAYLQNLQFNKELALENTQKLIDLKLAAGKQIDGIELLNNLLYSHNAWRDNDVRVNLAQTLMRLEEKYGATTPGLSYLHASGVYIDTEQYTAAKTTALAAIARVKHETLRMAAQLNLATAQAGMGKTVEAKTLLNSLPEGARSSAKGKYALALIALREGRATDALTLMNERYDGRVRRFLEDKSNNTTEMLASLENSSARQAEREAALKREATLIQTRLHQQQQINRLLIGMSFLALTMGLGAVIFARNRHKLSKLLKIKTEEAESADRMKTEFLGMVSHELRTPLNGIIGLADIISSQSEDEKTRQRAGIILSSGNLLFNLIESIIDMSRLDGGKMELVAQDCSIAEIAGKLAKKRQKEATEKGLIFTYHIPAAAAQPIEIDPVRIEQCIDTLLSNAVRFTEAGRVHLHLETKTDPASGQITFSVIVADTGQGMNEQVLEKLFTPFLQADTSMTRKHGGSGLRLAIARAMIRMMDGDITVVSREGKGSEFTMTFPAQPVLGTSSLNETSTRKEAVAESRSPATRPSVSAKPVKKPAKRSAKRRKAVKTALQHIQTSQDQRPLAPAAHKDTSINILPDRTPVLRDEDSVFKRRSTKSGKTKSRREGFQREGFETDNFEAEIVESSLPSVRKQAASSPSGEIKPTAADMKSMMESLHNSRVLIVDDDASNRDVVEILLKPVGIDCFAVESGADALNMMEAYYFDVVIMDIRMPDMSGTEAIRQIRRSGQAWANVPVIALTADIAAENNAACMAAGADIFLTKPILAKDLLEAICFVKFQDKRSSAMSDIILELNELDQPAIDTAQSA